MARKRFAAGQRSTSAVHLLVWLVLGIGIGAVAGFIFMGTVHTMLASRGADHYGSAPVAGTSTKPPAGTIHILMTSNGSPYQNYQTRILLGTYEIIKGMPGGERHVGITRILHRTKPDILMEIIDTFHATPLQPACDGWCNYPVSDRGNAMRQFFDSLPSTPDRIKGEWLYMIESDYVFMKPLGIPSTPPEGYAGWAFPFNYINPIAVPNEMQKLSPGVDVKSIPPTGPAPIVLSLQDWIKVTPSWERLTAAIEADTEVRDRLGWVREMYAFSLALVETGIKVELRTEGQSPFIAHLPGQAGLGEAHAFHYTLCTIYKTMDGGDAWGFDKRFYTEPQHALELTRIPPMPEFEAGKYKFVEGPPVTLEKHNAIKQMIDQINKGMDLAVPLPEAAKARAF